MTCTQQQRAASSNISEGLSQLPLENCQASSKYMYAIHVYGSGGLFSKIEGEYIVYFLCPISPCYIVSLMWSGGVLLLRVSMNPRAVLVAA